MSKIKNTPVTLDNAVVNARRAANEVRATWMALFYEEAKKDGIDLEPIMRRAIRKTGYLSGLSEKEKLGEGEVTARKFGTRFVTRSAPETFEKEVVQDTEDEYVVDFHYCSLVSAWQKLGIDDETCAKLCDIAMEGDKGVAEALGLDFELGDTIAAGDDTCNLCFKTRK